MTLAKTVFKNISYLLIARLTFRVLSAVAIIAAARYLGDERYGMFETASAWANAFLALNDVGMSTLIVREAARDPKRASVYFGNTLIVEIVLSILLYGIIIGIGILLHYDQTIIALMFILGAAGLVYEFRKVMRGVFRVSLNMRPIAILEILNGACHFLLTLWIIATITNRDLGLLSIAHAHLWVNVLIVIALFIYTLRLVRPTVNLRLVLPMIKQSYVFTLYNVFFMLYFQIDQIILSIMEGSRSVGIYSAAAKIVTILLFVPLMVFQVTMPLMYRYSKDDMEKYKRINRVIWRYLAAFGIPAGIGLWFLAPEIIPLLYGKQYLGSILILQVFGWFLAVRFLGIAQGNSLTTTDRQGLRATIQMVSVGINIVLDIVLIKQYGTIGAAIATLITEILISGSYLVTSARFLGEPLFRNFQSMLPIIGATGIMVSVLALAKPYLSSIIIMIFGVLSYLLSLWLFRFFNPYDRTLFQQIISRQ